MTEGQRTGYYVLLLMFAIASVIMIDNNQVPIPGPVLFVIVYALYSDWQLSKKTQNDHNSPLLSDAANKTNVGSDIASSASRSNEPNTRVLHAIAPTLPQKPYASILSPPSSLTAREVLDDEYDFWAQALSEFEGTDRHSGVWAKCFSLCNGDEARAKAMYLRLRVDTFMLASTAVVSVEAINKPASPTHNFKTEIDNGKSSDPTMSSEFWDKM